MVPGHENAQLFLEIDFWKGNRVKSDSPEVKITTKGLKCVVSYPAGEFELTQKFNFFTQEARMIYNGTVIQVVPPINSGLALAACWPFVLLIVGGGIGGLCGGVAASVNLYIVKTSLPLAVRLILCFLVGFLAIFMWLILAVIITLLLKRP